MPDEIKGLKLQAATIRLVSEAVKVEEPRRKGATKAQIEQAQAAVDTIEAYKDQVEIAEEIEALQKITGDILQIFGLMCRRSKCDI